MSLALQVASLAQKDPITLTKELLLSTSASPVPKDTTVLRKEVLTTYSAQDQILVTQAHQSPTKRLLKKTTKPSNLDFYLTQTQSTKV